MEAIAPWQAVLIQICICLCFLLVFWNLSSPPTYPQTPGVSLENANEDDDVNYTLEVIEIRLANPPSIMDVNYILLDDRMTAVPGVQGNLTDILNLDPNHNSTNITFYDNDHDENLTAGDTFWIKNAVHGGEAHWGYAFLLKFKVTGDKMNGGGTKLN